MRRAETVRTTIGPSRNESGATAVEYGLLVFAVAAAIVAAVYLLGPVVRDLFGQTCDSVQTTLVTTATCS